MYKRWETKKVFVKDVQIGGNRDVVIQSMCTSKTHNVEETLKQINLLKDNGCQIVRLAVLDQRDATALKEIIPVSPVPLVADIHFNYRLALMAIDAGIHKIRWNPGNIKKLEHVEEVVKALKVKKIPVRVGINSGSLDNDILEEYGLTALGLFKSAEKSIKALEKFGFEDIVVSLKSSNPLLAIEAYRMFANKYDYPLHLGITEVGDIVRGSIKTSFGLGTLLNEGLGNTVRVSITGDPTQEIFVAKEVLNMFDLVRGVPKLIACPTCGRLEYNMVPLVDLMDKYLKTVYASVKVAVMGCVVNGPGEARDCDIAVVGGRKNVLIYIDGVMAHNISQDDCFPKIKEIIDGYVKENFKDGVRK